MSKSFCMAPWVHANVEPTGIVRMCCIAQGEQMGNINTEQINDVWNGSRYKTIRLKMINNEPVEECRRCNAEESWGNTNSMRDMFNNLYKDKQHLVAETNEDGSLDTMELIRWDFRFSNFCNLACIGCSPAYSSTWVPIARELYAYKGDTFMTSKSRMDAFTNAIGEHVHHVRDVYFAGGEPLIQPEHYDVLERIEKADRLEDISFCYSTNLTTISYKGKSIFEYWEKMKKLRLLISIDEVTPERLHYIRYPSKLDTLLEHIKMVKKELTTPEKSFSLTPTWGILNTHRIKEFMEWVIENDLLPDSYADSLNWEYDFHNIILFDPAHLSVGAASPEWKAHLHRKINEYFLWYKKELISRKREDLRQDAGKILMRDMLRFHAAIDRDTGFDKTKWKYWIRKLDDIRGTQFEEIFPELSWHYQ